MPDFSVCRHSDIHQSSILSLSPLYNYFHLLIQEIGLREEDVYITSTVKYLPDKGTPPPSDIVHGRKHLMKQLDIIRPKFVILLGRVAAEGVLQRKVAVVKDRGKMIEEKDLPVGRQGRQVAKVKYFLTYHPAAALRFPHKFKQLLKEDFQKVKALARGIKVTQAAGFF